MASPLHKEQILGYAQWTNSTIRQYMSYHDHKETMAWVATALYLPAIITFGISLRHMTNLPANPTRIIFSILVLLGSFFFFIFINMQFKQRWLAADQISALMRAQIKVLSAWNELTLEDKKVEVDSESCNYKQGDDIWPKFIKREIDRCSPKRDCWKTSLTNLLTLRWQKVDPRWKTEFPSYAMFIGATAISIVLIWLRSKPYA